jgi:hypothetical protein
MRFRVLLSLGLLSLAMAGCAGEPTAPQPSAQVEGSGLTSAQAERLAVTRFRNFDAGTRAVSFIVPQTEAGEIRVTGWFDFERGVGYGAIAGGGTVWWNPATVAIRDTPSTEAVIPLPADGWVSYPLDPQANPLATALALVGSLGADRPENPQLLAQSDAVWLRSDTVGGTPVDIFAGPSGDGAATPTASGERARYWVDDTGTLLFFEAPIGDEWMTVTFSESGSVSLPTVSPGAP